MRITLNFIKEYNRVRYVTKSFPCNRTELYIKVISAADISQQTNTLLIFLEVEFNIVAKHPFADMTYQIGLANLPSAIYQKYFVWFIPQKSLYVRCKFPEKHSIFTFYANVIKIKHIQNSLGKITRFQGAKSGIILSFV